jgi:hypothetical protein
MNFIAATFVLVAVNLTVATGLVPYPVLGEGRDNPAQPSAKPKSERFAKLRALEGRWRGEGNGQPGKSTVERSYEFVLGGKYLNARNSSVYAPQPKNPKGEHHEDWGMFSYDAGRKKLVLRQFHIEGFVNQYVLDRESDDGKELVFVSEAIENIPKGFRARETYRFNGADSFEEIFELASPNQDFEVYTRTIFSRVK